MTEPRPHSPTSPAGPSLGEDRRAAAPAFASGGRGNYDLFIALFCSLLLLSNVGATKLLAFGPEVTIGSYPLFPVITDGGAFLFPLTYIVGDILAEVFGLLRARRAIVLSAIVGITASFVFLAVDLAPPAPDYPYATDWHHVLGFVPRIVLASLLGYVAGQFLTAVVLVRIKQRMGEGRLWVRLLGSSLVGELADTLLFCVVAWIGVVSTGTLINYVITGYVYKVVVETVFLPVTTRVIAVVKRHEPDYGVAAS
ncbi:MAG: queuosine precursor transporter [Propionibacteriaceae bacterium]|nr:queuosine precursor transporter [Propionibacteriaceae bacterium]